MVAMATGSPTARSVADRVTRDEAHVVAQFRMPTGARFAVFVARGVPAVAGDHRVSVAAVRIDRDPAPFAFFAPALERAGGKRAFEEATAVQGVTDRARAVVATVDPAGVAAAPDVGLAADFVGSGDHGLDARGRAL